jgi:myo-inositol-1(or 4)-monophosphatase
MDDVGSLGSERAAAALEALAAAARLGGEAALTDFRPGGPTRATIAYKHGDSPVTSADLAVDRQLAAALRPQFPEAGWLSEETEDDLDRLNKTRLLVLDPIDGTRAFMRGDPCWTVAIALVENGRPVAGVVHAPALGETFAASLGRGATLNGEPIHAARLAALEGVRVAGPRGLTAAFAAAAGFRPAPAPKTPSLAYRLACVAAGRIEIGLAGANSQDWDIAAADVILREAGAELLEGGSEVRYNQSDTRHGPLLAAPREWLARLTPAFAGIAPPPGRRA